MNADLSTDHRPLASPEQSGEGLLKRQPMCLRLRRLLQLDVRPEPDPKDADGSVTSAEGLWRDIASPPSTEPQTFAFEA